MKPPPAFPVLDLNRAGTRKTLLLLLALTLINVVILTTATYKGVEVMNSTDFGLGRGYLVHLGYRTVDYDEMAFDFDDNDSDIAEISTGYRWR